MNMRKIIAVLAAVLMLCAMIPMAALSVSADGSFDFEGGTVSGWQSGCNIEVVDMDGSKVLKFDASGADWANVYYYGSSIVSANTDYTVSFRAKADRATNMNFKVNNNWAGDTAKQVVDVTTEWQEYSFVLNSGDCTSGALLMFSSNTYAPNGATYYIDDISFVEYVAPVEPGTIVNGDFETGDLSGWNHHQSTAISTDAHSGSYAANIKGNGGWGGMLDQNVSVEAGKTYAISIWVKAIANGTNIQVKDGGTEGANLESTWFTATEWTELTWEVTPTTNVICFNFCGGGNGVAEDVLVDDITIAEVKQASFDGFVSNGDFEIGDGTAWTLYSGSNVSADAAYTGSYGLICTNPNGGWGGTAFQDFNVTVGKSYKVTMWAKNLDGARGQNIQIQNPIGTTVASKWFDNTTEWTLLTFEFTATSTDARINISGGGTGANEMAYIDDIKVVELVDPSDDGFIKNGNFESGEATPWTLYSGTAVSAEAAYTGNFGLHIKNPTGGWGGTAFQDFTVTVGKTYEVTMWAKNLDGARGQNIQIQNGGTTVASKWFDNTTTWTLLTFEFTATAANCRINICGGGTSANEELYVDDIQVVELIDPSFDGYIYNGDFETGRLAPWHNQHLSSGSYEIVEGYEGGSALYVNAPKQWGHIRQDGIAVKPNTDYRLSLLVKNAQNMAIVIKKGDDSGDLTPGDADHAIPAGEDWQLYTIEFNTGVDKDGNAIDIDSICVLVISYVDDGSVIIDNVTLEEVVGCQHEYFYACDKHCMNCGELTNPDAAHHIEHVEAKPAGSCIDFGNKEYWYCTDCGAAWLDANLIRQTNLKSVTIAGECISDSPACKDGVCINCGLPCNAEAEHEYDNDYDADCNVCGEIREVEAPEIVYGDADGDGEVTALDAILLGQFVTGWDVELNEVSADADGDGEVTALDAILLGQFVTGWDVELGPQV